MASDTDDASDHESNPGRGHKRVIAIASGLLTIVMAFVGVGAWIYPDPLGVKPDGEPVPTQSTRSREGDRNDMESSIQGDGSFAVEEDEGEHRTNPSGQRSGDESGPTLVSVALHSDGATPASPQLRALVIDESGVANVKINGHLAVALEDDLWSAEVSLSEARSGLAQLTASDRLGYTASAAMVFEPLRPDDSPPRITRVTPAFGSQVPGGEVVLEISAHDDSNFVVTIDGVEARRDQTSFVYRTVCTAGVRTFTISAIDEHGNRCGGIRHELNVVAPLPPSAFEVRVIFSGIADGYRTKAETIRKRLRDKGFERVALISHDKQLKGTSDEYIEDAALAEIEPERTNLAYIPRDAEHLRESLEWSLPKSVSVVLRKPESMQTSALGSERMSRLIDIICRPSTKFR